MSMQYINIFHISTLSNMQYHDQSRYKGRKWWGLNLAMATCSTVDGCLLTVQFVTYISTRCVDTILLHQYKIEYIFCDFISNKSH